MTPSEFQSALKDEGRAILNFWMQVVLDIDNDRIWGQVNNDNSRDPQARLSGILVSRIVWTFSRAYCSTQSTLYLKYAEFAYNYLIEQFWDHKHGGIYWEVSPDGDASDTRKQIYAQAFAIYALSEFYLATGFEDALEKALYLFTLIDQHASDQLNKGYMEACTRSWEPAAELVLSSKEDGSKKTMNTHLHVMEAYAYLLRALPADIEPADSIGQLSKSLANLIHLLTDTIYDHEKGHLDLYFSDSWEVGKREYSPGHDIEAAWLLNEAANILLQHGDQNQITGYGMLSRRVAIIARALVDKTLETGMRRNGSLITDYPAALEYSGHIEQSRLSEWWPQAEAWTGFLEAYSKSGDTRYFNAALAAFNWGMEHLKDKTGGEWFYGYNADGTLSESGKAGFWKCPYHSYRGCDQSVKILEALETTDN